MASGDAGAICNDYAYFNNDVDGAAAANARTLVKHAGN
jgi:uncharacterized protein YecE (DUF72 family)